MRFARLHGTPRYISSAYRKTHTPWQQRPPFTEGMALKRTEVAAEPARRSITNRSLRPVALVALVAIALFAGACGSSTPGATNSTTNSTAGHGEAVTFSQCMRNNGVSNFPDPSSSGQFTIDEVANGSGIDTNSSAFQQALGACKSLEPSGFTGTQRTPQQQAAALKFAQCMRNNGITSFPDPSPDGPIISVNGAHSIPGFQTALAKCSAIYSGQMGLKSQ